MPSKAEQLARKEIIAFILAAAGKKPVEITYPPRPEWGDFSVPCFSLGNRRQTPAEVATALAGKFDGGKYILLQSIRAAGPYLNFFVDEKKFSGLVIKQILTQKEKYGRGESGKNKTIMVEYFSPNTNKPLTVGHLRNICLGESVAKILRELGYKVITSSLYNDRGIALCKTIVAYQKWGGHRQPGKIKPDHFAGKFYVMFNKKAARDKKLEAEAKECLVSWEKNDGAVKKIWQRLSKWTVAGFDQTLKNIGAADFDEKYFESDIYKKGRDIVLKGLEKKIFKKHPDGYIYAPLQKYGLPDKILLRADGTSLYIVQDIYLAILKNKNNLDKSIYVVGAEQDLAMRQLYKILEMLGKKFENYHLSYGMMRLPEGKIKSREGLVKGTGADELLDQLNKLALVEVKKREKKIGVGAAKARAHQIALAALKYYILEVNPKSEMIFEPKKSLAFTGRTGPYLQYVYARIASILRQRPAGVPARRRHWPMSPSEVEENALITTLAKFPAICEKSATDYDPSHLAHYLYELAKSFSTFYENIPVLKAEKNVRQFRLALIIATQIVMKKGLSLLGIKAIDKM